MNDQAQTRTPLDESTALDSLQELAVLYKSIEDVLTDDIITRVGATVGEGLVLLDRLTRNEGLMRLMHALGRPENQFLLMGLADALTETSRQLADSEPAKGGIGQPVHHDVEVVSLRAPEQHIHVGLPLTAAVRPLETG